MEYKQVERTAFFILSIFILFNSNILAQEKANKYKFEIVPIDSIQYDALYQEYYRAQTKSIKIDSLDLVEEELKNIVVFDETGAVKTIKPTKGKMIEFDEYDRPFFLSYFPSENIIYLEGGHSADISYDLTTGEDNELVGIPFYIVSSPSNKFRINGYWSGQECSFYFMQENKGVRFRKVGDIEDDNLCNIYTSFWTDDRTFYYSLLTSDYATDEEKEAKHYQGQCYKLTIVDN